MAKTIHFILLLSLCQLIASWACSRRASESKARFAQAQTSTLPSPSPSPSPQMNKLAQAEQIDKIWVNRFKFVTKSIAEKHEGNRGYEISVDIPQIGGTRMPATRRFNRWMRTKILGYVAQFRRLERSAEIHDKRKKLHPLSIDESLEIGYRAYYSNSHFISLRLTQTVMAMGQMHPIAYYQTINYDLKRGRPLRPPDVFKTGYLKVLSAYCRKELRDKYGLTYTTDPWVKEGTIPKRNNFPNWNIVPEGILISFEDYQVAPHAFGQPEMIVPYSILKSVMKKKQPTD